MGWVIILLLVLLLLLVLVVLIGHGLWVMFAWMFRRTPPPPDPPYVPHAVPIPALPVAGTDFARDRDEWETTGARVEELFQAGYIDSATFLAVRAAIQSRQAHDATQPHRAPTRPPPLPTRPVEAFQPAEPVAAAAPTEAVPGRELETAPEPAEAAVEAAEPSDAALPEPGRLPFPPRLPQALPPAPAAPARPLSQVLASFMESRNIRWGELVGGLLIVGCSVALALSFWAEIAQRPLMKFSVFTAVTAALFALGLYSEHRWKLPTTSRGILLTSTLLVPLNFLAFAAFSRGAAAADPVALGGEAVAFGLFLWLTALSARVIAPQWPLLLTAGVMTLSTASLAVRYLSVPAAGAEGMTAVLPAGRMLWLAAAVVGAYEAAGAALVLRARRWKALDADAGGAVLLLVGVLSFAVVFPLLLIAGRSGEGALHRLAPLLGLAGLTPMAAGLLLWKRTNDPAAVRMRVAGTGAAVCGAAVLLGGIALSWPDPAELLPAAAVAFVALAAVALLLRIPAAHAPALACGAAAWLLAFHLVAGNVGWWSDSERLAATLSLPSGGAALAGFVALATGAAALLRRRGMDADARVHLGAGFAAAVVSGLLLARGVVTGAGSPVVASAAFALYAGLGLAWALADESTFWLNAAQVAAALAAAAGGVAMGEHGIGLRAPAALAEPATWKAVGVALAGLSLVWGLVRVYVQRRGGAEAAGTTNEVHVGDEAGVDRRPGDAGVAPTGRPGDAGVAPTRAADVDRAGDAGVAPTRAVVSSGRPGDAGVAPTGAVVSAGRAGDAGVAPAWQYLARAPSTFDRLTTLVLALALAAAAIYVAGFGLVAELAPRGQPLDAAPAARVVAAVAGIPPWLMLALLVGACGAAAGDRRLARAGQAVAALAWLACPLGAALCSVPTATSAGASALRWLAAAWFVAGAALVGWRDRARARGDDSGPATGLARLLLLLGVLPVAALSLWAAGVAMIGEASGGPGAGSLFARLGPAVNYGGPLLALAGAFVVAAARRRSGGFALAALLCTNLLVTTVYAVAVAGPAGGLDWAGVARLAQLNIAAAGGFALAWLAALAFYAGRTGRAVESPGSLAAVVRAALGLNVLLVVPAAGAMFLLPGSAGSLPSAEVGGAWGWLALGLSTAAALGLMARGRGRASPGAAGAALSMAAAMAGLTAAGWDRGNWLAFHVWMAAQTAAAWAMLGLGWWLHRGGAAGLAVLFEEHRRVTASDETEPDGIPQQHGHHTPSPDPPGEGGGEGEEGNAEVGMLNAESGAQPSPSPIRHSALIIRHSPEDPHPALSRSTGRGEERASAEPPNALDYLAPSTAPAARAHDVRESAARWAGLLGLVSVALALRAALGDPLAPWPSVADALCVGMLAAAAAVWLRAPGGLYAAGLLMNFAATLAWVFEHSRLGGGFAIGLLAVNAAALGLPAVAALVLELHLFRRPGVPTGPARLPYHRFAAGLSVALLGAVTGATLAGRLGGSPFTVNGGLDAAAFASVAALLLACLWDASAAAAPVLLHLLGLFAAGEALGRRDLTPQDMGWLGALVLAGYGLLTSGLWAARGPLASAASALGIPAVRRRTDRWLVPATELLAAAVLALAVRADFTFDAAGRRLLPAVAATAQAVSLAMLAGGALAGPARRLRAAAVLVAVAGLTTVGWSSLAPSAGGYGLAHAALAAGWLTLAAVASALAFAGRPAPPNDWPAAVRTAAPSLAVLCLGALSAALGLEVVAQLAIGRVPMPAWAVAALATAPAAACAAAVLLALRPSEGLSGFSERTRSAFVYLAEALLAGLFAHVRLTLPQLFHGYLRQYWPLVVMAVAFAGVGVGEVLRRRRLTALAAPLQRTGAFLPLLPVLAFWLASSHVHYTALLLVVGALYASLAVLRRSTGFGLLAALAGNAGLWYLLYGSEAVGFLAHPQLWVIPAALSALAAVELNRAALGAAQVRAARYGCMVAVYLSSTADIFINGSAHSPWLPLVLAALSVAGVLAGVTFRVRPFLFLGTGFLTLSLVAIIYNASASLHVTWIWYVAGIGLGLFIIFLFALFEKKRATMLALVEGLKEWD